MTDSISSLPRHKDDFGRVCDLEDPSPCFTALRPSDDRTPVVTEWGQGLGAPGLLLLYHAVERTVGSRGVSLHQPGISSDGTTPLPRPPQTQRVADCTIVELTTNFRSRCGLAER